MGTGLNYNQTWSLHLLPAAALLPRCCRHPHRPPLLQQAARRHPVQVLAPVPCPHCSVATAHANASLTGLNHPNPVLLPPLVLLTSLLVPQAH